MAVYARLRPINARGWSQVRLTDAILHGYFKIGALDSPYHRISILSIGLFWGNQTCIIPFLIPEGGQLPLLQTVCIWFVSPRKLIS